MDRDESEAGKELRAAVLIQKMVRGIRGRIEYRRRRMWAAWNLLDVSEEKQLANTHDEYEAIKEVYARAREKHERMATVHSREEATVEDDSGVPRLPQGPITLDFVTAVMDHFKEGGLLHRDDVARIVREVQFLHSSQPNVVEANFSARMTVVGDLHGQLDDLFSVFKLNGLPSPRNWYLFNGDFVDRGQHSVECVLVLYCLKMLYPSAVFLNRGNHEARDLNSRDGFARECMVKYDADMFDLFSESFAALPLATLLNRRVFVVHGGLFWDDLSLANIQAIERFHEVPPPGSHMEQMLWSDPSDTEGREHNPRGTSCLYGADVAHTFLRNNRLSMIVRSHECMEDGFELRFGGRLLTIFSASNYCLADDHEILTDRGFLSMREYVALHDRGEAVRVASYDQARRAMVYERAERYVVNPAAPQGMVRFAPAAAGDAAEGVDLLVTPEHDMFVQVGGGARAARPAKMRAGDVAALGRRKVRLVLRPENGAATTGAGAVPCAAALGLATDGECDAFLRLYGAWLGGGGALLDGAPRVGGTAFVRRQLDALGLREGAGAGAGDYCADGRGGVVLVRDAYARLLGGAARGVATGGAARPWPWVFDLPRGGARAVLEGLASGAQGAASVVARTAALRDDVVRLALHAGVAARARARGDAPGAGWDVALDEEGRGAELDVAEAVRGEAYEGPTWCVTVPHGLIWARRRAAGERGAVSQPVLVGNCGVAGNLGAFCIFDAELRYQVVQYAAKPKESMGRYRLPHSVIADDVISRLLRRIAENRVALANHYHALDTDGDGTVTRVEWAEGLRKVLEVDIPFLEFQSYLGLPKLGVRGEESGRVDYHAFLERYRIHVTTQGGAAAAAAREAAEAARHEDETLRHAVDKVGAVLYRNRLQLEAMFRCFDTNGDGQLSPHEFRDGLLSLNSLMSEPVTTEEIELLTQHVDADGDGAISYEEFFEGFKLADESLSDVLDRSQAARQERKVGVNYRGEEHEHVVVLENEAGAAHEH